MCGAHGLWHNEIEGVSDGFRCAMAGERLCPAIPQANHSRTIHKEDGVRSVRNQRCFQGSCFHDSQRSFLIVRDTLRLCFGFFPAPPAPRLYGCGTALDAGRAVLKRAVCPSFM
jgi:hypothetical protein